MMILSILAAWVASPSLAGLHKHYDHHNHDHHRYDQDDNHHERYHHHSDHNIIIKFPGPAQA